MIKKYVFLLNILLIFGQCYSINEKHDVKKNSVKNSNTSRKSFKTAIIKRDLCIIGTGLLLYAIGIYTRIFRFPINFNKIGNQLHNYLNPQCWVKDILKESVKGEKCSLCKKGFHHNPVSFFCGCKKEEKLLCKICVSKNKYTNIEACPFCTSNNFEKKAWETCGICKTKKFDASMRCFDCPVAGNNSFSCVGCLKGLNNIRKNRVDNWGNLCPLPSVNCPFCYDGKGV